MIYFGKNSAVKIEMKGEFDIRLVVQYQSEVVVITARLREHRKLRDVTKWIKNEFRWNIEKHFEGDFSGFEDDSSPLGIITYDRMDAMTSADYIFA